MKTLLTALFAIFSLALSAQQVDIPVEIILKDGRTIKANHFGQSKCGNDTYAKNQIHIKGKFLDNVTEISSYKDIAKIILIGYSKDPVSSVGNEKGTISVVKKDGVSVDLEDADIYMTCYGPGDKYNTLIVKLHNPITNQAAEKVIPTKDIQSVVFK